MVKNAAKPKLASRQDAIRELRIGRELADTTWRITVPVIVFAGTGLFADRSLGSAPWATLAGMAIGFVLAGLLVGRQLSRWPDKPVVPGSYERNRRPGDQVDDPDADEYEKRDYYND